MESKECSSCSYWEQHYGNFAGDCSKLAELVEIIINADCGCSNAEISRVLTAGDFSCSGYKKKNKRGSNPSGRVK